MTDESKFKFMYTYSEYDVIRVIVKGINDNTMLEMNY
jgi:hypothetical protein